MTDVVIAGVRFAPMPWARLHELGVQTLATTTSKGFDLPVWGGDDEPSTYLSKLMLVVTEIDEAESAAGVYAFALELADVAIRVLGILESCHPGWHTRAELVDVADFYESLGAHENFVPRKGTDLLWCALLRPCVFATEDWRKNRRKDAEAKLVHCLHGVFFVAAHGHWPDIDVITAIEEKDAKNRGRAHLHGDKKANG